MSDHDRPTMTGGVTTRKIAAAEKRVERVRKATHKKMAPLQKQVSKIDDQERKAVSRITIGFSKRRAVIHRKISSILATGEKQERAIFQKLR